MVDCIVCIDDVERIKDCLLFVLQRISRTSALRFAPSGRWGINMASKSCAVDARFRVFSFYRILSVNQRPGSFHPTRPPICNVLNDA